MIYVLMTSIVPRNLALLATGRYGVRGVVFARPNSISGGNRIRKADLTTILTPKSVKQIGFTLRTTVDCTQCPTILVWLCCCLERFMSVFRRGTYVVALETQ